MAKQILFGEQSRQGRRSASITANAGVEGAVVVTKVHAMTGDHGFNAATEVYEDLVTAGVIDPAKVVRTTLQNAASVASLLLTADALVSELS